MANDSGVEDLPDGTKLGEAKLRGIESRGMILSETELEIGGDASGIAVLETGPLAGSLLTFPFAIPLTGELFDLAMDGGFVPDASTPAT